MSNDFSPSVAGGWLGAYYYESRVRMPVRFEATFARSNGGEGGGERFGGTILDDEGGGEAAEVSLGVQQGTFIRFVKIYSPPAPGVFPVHYVGTLSSDGRLMTGHWKIMLGESRRARAREIVGTWEARRSWSPAEDETGGENAAGQEAGQELAGARAR